jgi:hypothetical protein
MELREFVAEAIKQISAGVKDAQATYDEHGAFVNPHLSTSADLAVKHGILIASGHAAQLVQFDIALTVTEGTGTKGGIGVFVGAFSLGSSGQSSAENSSVSRVKFFVPLVLPEGNGP